MGDGLVLWHPESERRASPASGRVGFVLTFNSLNRMSHSLRTVEK